MSLTASTQTFCGGCGHPLHWHECGAGASLTAPCRCRNDVAVYNAPERMTPPTRPQLIPYRDTWANGRASRYRRPFALDDHTNPEPVWQPSPVVLSFRGCAWLTILAALALFWALVIGLALTVAR